jgi:hypothetical protein
MTEPTPPPTPTPSTLLGLLSDLGWPLEALVGLQADTVSIQTDTVAIRAALLDITTQLNRIEGTLKIMGAQEQAAAAQLETDIATVANGWTALQSLVAAQAAQITDLQGQLAAAGVAQTAAVAAQASTDDTQAAADIDAGDTALQNLLNPPAAPAPSE